MKQEVNWWKTWASSACTEGTGNCHFPGYSSKKRVKQTNYIHKSPNLQPPLSDVYLHPENTLTNHLIFLIFAWKELHALFMKGTFEMHREHFWGKTALLEARWGCKPPSLGAKASYQIQVISHPTYSELTALEVQVWQRKPTSSRWWKVPPLLIKFFLNEVWFSS